MRNRCWIKHRYVNPGLLRMPEHLPVSLAATAVFLNEIISVGIFAKRNNNY